MLASSRLLSLLLNLNEDWGKKNKESFWTSNVKAGTDYGTYSGAQPDAAAKNMMFASVDSQQTSGGFTYTQTTQLRRAQNFLNKNKI